jgi:hypothetical protein
MHTAIVTSEVRAVYTAGLKKLPLYDQFLQEEWKIVMCDGTSGVLAFAAHVPIVADFLRWMSGTLLHHAHAH